MLPPGGGPDFAGNMITEIDLTFNDLTFRQVQLPVSFVPIVFGPFTEADLDVTITVQGNEVPEPWSAPLVAAALVVLALLDRRRSVHPEQ